MSELEEKLLDSFQDKDGLIKIIDLEQCKKANSERTLFKLKNNKDYNQLLLYPSHRALSVIDYLVHDPTLSNLSSIRVSTHDTGMNAAPWFGPRSFERAINDVIREKFVRSLFYIHQEDNLSGFVEGKGVACYLVVHLGAKEENGQMKFHLEAWNGNEVDTIVYYIHCIFSKPFALQQLDQAIIEHLDGAIIQYTQLDKDELFYKGNKKKGVSYQKQFRLDGEISSHILYEIAKIYFPIDSLTEEYFGLNGITSDNNIQRYRVSANDF